MELSEESLVSQLNPRDGYALGELFARYRPRLWKIARLGIDPRLTGRIDPDDVLQEAYLVAARRITHFIDEFKQSIFVWFRLIVKQTLIDLHRFHLGTQRRDAQREFSFTRAGSGQSSVSIAQRLLADVTSPSQALNRVELTRRLESALEAMSPTDREILALRHFEELTNQEVAEVLNIKPKAASIRYIRAIAKLKEVLGGTSQFLQ